MDIRKFFGGNTASTTPKPPTNPTPAPQRTTQAPTSPPPASTAQKLTNKPQFLDSDSDEDDVIVIKKGKALPPNTRVQLPPPRASKLPQSGNSQDDSRNGPQKSQRMAKKRFRDDSSFSSGSSSSSSSDSFSSDSDSSSGSGSDSFFGESDFDAIDDDDDDDDGRPGKSKRGQIVKNAAKNTSKSSKSTMNDDIKPSNRAQSKKTESTDTKTQKSPVKRNPKPNPSNSVSADWDYSDLAIEMAPLPPASKFVINPATGKSAPIWTVTVTAAPPPYAGMRSTPKGSSHTFATGGGGPNAKKRDTPMTFVITGTLKSLSREQCEDLIKENGGKITSAPSGRTDFLVLGEEPGPSKVNKAIENGTWIIDEDGLFKLILKKNPTLRQPPGLMLDEVDDQNGGYPNFNAGSNSGQNRNRVDIDDGGKKQPQVESKPQQTQPPPTSQPINSPPPAAPTPSTTEAPKKGSLYARKAQGMTPSTTTTTTTTTTTSALSPPSLATASTQTLVSPTQSTQTPTPSNNNSNNNNNNNKGGLYVRKSTSTIVSPAASTVATVATIPSTTSTADVDEEAIQFIDMSNLPVLPNYPGTNDNDLWVDRFKPTSAEQICGNNTTVAAIVEWLNDWQRYYENDMFEGGSRAPKLRAGEDGAVRRAILLSGGPGIGKTTAATLCAKKSGRIAIEYNASDTRSQKSIRDEIGDLVDSSTLGKWFNKADPNPPKRKSNEGTGKVIIMDEVDGVSASDRGGMAELIKIIKTTATPIICICNDASSDKVKSLKNYCKTYSWSRPRATQVTHRLQTIALSQGMKVDDRAMEAIFQNTGNDLRATINYLQMLASTRRGTVITYNDSKHQREDNKKDMEVNSFELVGSFFRPGVGPNWFNQHMNNVYFDQDLIPKFIFENYLRARPQAHFGRPVPKMGQLPTPLPPKNSYQRKLVPKNPKKGPIIADFNTVFTPPTAIVPIPPAPLSTTSLVSSLRMLSTFSHSVDAISYSEHMMDETAFHTSSVNSALAVLYPGQALSGGLSGMVMFPSLLGKTSSTNKAFRVGILFRQIFSKLTTPLSRREFILNYLPNFHLKLINLLLQNNTISAENLHHIYGDDYSRVFKADRYGTGVECVAHLLSWLGINKDDYDLLIEQNDNIISGAYNFDNIFHTEKEIEKIDPKKIGTKLDSKKVPTYSNLIQTSIKSSLTRTMNKIQDFKTGSRPRVNKGVDKDPMVMTEEREFEIADKELVLTSDDESDEKNDSTSLPSPVVVVTTTKNSGATKKQKLK
jgi:DNA polymerase III delta prime subunit